MIELTLPTMTCGHCVRSVTDTVKAIDPQAALTINLPSHQLLIDSRQPAALFAAALAEDGYAPA